MRLDVILIAITLILPTGLWPQAPTSSQNGPVTVHVTFVGVGSSTETFAPLNGLYENDVYTASLKWRARWDVMLPDPRAGFPNQQNYAPALRGTSVTGQTTVTRTSKNGNCTGAPRINTNHGGLQPQQSPFIGFLAPDPANAGSTKISMWVEAFGGYDFRLCDGLWLPAVGDYPPPDPGYPTWDTSPVIVKFTIDTKDWIGQGAKTMRIPVGMGSGDGQGSYTTVAGADDYGSVQWSGEIILDGPCSGASMYREVIEMKGLPGCPSKGPAQGYSPKWGSFGVKPKLESTQTGTLELRCDDVLKPGEFQFLLLYTPPDGTPIAVGSCKWPFGCNTAWFGWERPDTDSTGAYAPACIDETDWITRDYGPNTLNADNNSFYTNRPENPPLLDRIIFHYDVFTNQLTLTDEAYAYLYMPVPQCGDDRLNGHPPEGALLYKDTLGDTLFETQGDVTRALVAKRLGTSDQLPPGVSVGSPYAPGDFNLDGNVDAQDAAVIQNSMGRCIPDALFAGTADMDHDGCLTLRDYKVWFPMYQSQPNAGSQGQTVAASLAPSAPVVNVGDTFTVSLVADISDPIVAWGVAVDFSSSALSLNSVTVDPAWLSATGSAPDELIGLAFPNPVSGANTVLATLSFTALAPGSAALTLSVNPPSLTEGFPLAEGGYADFTVQSATVSVGGSAAASHRPRREPPGVLVLGHDNASVKFYCLV